MTEVLPEAFPGFTWAWLQLGPGYWGWAQVGPAMSFTESSLSLAVSELAPMVDAAEVVPAVESIAAESAGLVGLSVSGGVLAVAGVMAVGAAFVVGAVLGEIGLADFISDIWDRDAVSVGGEHGLFFVMNAQNLTRADMKVLNDMHVRRDAEECCGATFTNYEMGWNRTGTMHRNEDHVKYGVRHGHFTIHMEDENKVDPQGLWIHLARNATKEQINEAEQLRKGLNASTLDHREAGKRLANIFGKLVNITAV